MAELQHHEAFDAFYRQVCPRLVSLGFVFSGERAQAQDLAQETLARAWKHWDQIRTYDDPGAWCRRVLCNLATSEWRSAKRRLAFPWRAGPPTEAGDSPDVEAVALAAALRALPAPQRTAIVLHDGAGLSAVEVAQQLHVPEGTVRSWLTRGRRLLAVELAIVDPTDRLDEATRSEEGIPHG